MYIAAIDPGMKGGWAVLDITTGIRLHAAGRMPVLKHGTKSIVDAPHLLTKVSANTGPVVIEQVASMPRQGVVSTFTFGASYGAALAVAQLAGRSLTLVPPARWKKHFSLVKDKRASLDRARLEFGSTGLVDWGVLANDGAAEAALIALWYAHTHVLK